MFAAGDAPAPSGTAAGPVTSATEQDTGLLYLYPFRAPGQTPPCPPPREVVPKGILKLTQRTGTESPVVMETSAKKVSIRPRCVLWCPLWLKEGMSGSCRVITDMIIIVIMSHIYVCLISEV